jgi:hypothetical protein
VTTHQAPIRVFLFATDLCLGGGPRRQRLDAAPGRLSPPASLPKIPRGAVQLSSARRRGSRVDGATGNARLLPSCREPGPCPPRAARQGRADEEWKR